ncbi:Eukaryotic translation initiation factor eIF-1 [Dimargaris xerosporica]|nr:Eukaryotic translation initiation factor eIF-1 [Dimargaris xerosporica]
MSDIQNLKSYDPFADLGEENTEVVPIDNVHIRIQQRNGRKSITTIQGLSKSIDFKRLLKAFKKEFACNGNVTQDEELGDVIQLQGDQRKASATFLVQQEICKKDQIKIHGF